MADTALRYLEMLQLIPRFPHAINTAELKDKLTELGYEINVRSIQRDLEKLSVSFPLIADESVRPYRWSFDAGASARMLPTLDMSTAITFELARAYLSPILPNRVMQHLEPHFREAHAVLKRNGNPLAHWPEKIRLISRGLGNNRPDIDAEVLEIVTQALLDEHQCRMTYCARNWKQPENITVHPLGLVFRDPNTYLIATIDGREGVRQLVMHRVSSVQALPDRINKPQGFELHGFIDSGAMHVLRTQESVDLLLRCDKPVLSHLLETPLAENQQVVNETETNFEVRVKLADSQDLRWWLLAQSAHLDILKPKWLRNEISERLNSAWYRHASI